MPILNRTRDPVRPTTTTAPAPRIPLPHHEVSLPARLRRLLTPSRGNRAWPASIALLALIVFIMFWAQATLLVALVAALAAVAAGALLLALMVGSGWITHARPPIPRRNR